jgi:hypothetical protein
MKALEVFLETLGGHASEGIENEEHGTVCWSHLERISAEHLNVAILGQSFAGKISPTFIDLNSDDSIADAFFEPEIDDTALSTSNVNEYVVGADSSIAVIEQLGEIIIMGTGGTVVSEVGPPTNIRTAAPSAVAHIDHKVPDRFDSETWFDDPASPLLPDESPI